MPIPDLNPEGFLPPGIHEGSLAELRARFGSFRGHDERVRLCARLEEMLEAMRRSGLFEALLVDGSFVTAKAVPNDIDVLALLKPGHDFERDLPMSEYALVSRGLLRRRYGFDVIVAERDSTLYKTYVEFFSRVRESPDTRKGLVQLRL